MYFMDLQFIKAKKISEAFDFPTSSIDNMVLLFVYDLRVIFLNSSLKSILWVLIRIALVRQFN